MVITDKISIQKTGASRLNQVDFSNIPFGKIYTDHMFLADYKNGAWSNQRIIPYGYMPISPATPALHYGQSIFEGMKAIRNDKDEVLIFRPYDNWQRLNKSGYRMCMPHLPEEIFVEGLRTLLDLDKNWIPKTEGSSLYIRPFMYSADEYINGLMYKAIYVFSR